MKTTREMISRLKDIEMEKRDLCSQLTDAVMKQPVLVEALKEGLVRLNFTAPSGFYRHCIKGGK